MRWIGAARVALVLLALAGGPALAAARMPDILVEAAAEGDWTVRYDLAKPAAELAFQRSTDGSRVETWAAPAGFEIVRTTDGERARRRDGKPFRRVSFTVPPRYRELPKDYAPFSPFGDGGMLVHSGRFFACQMRCEDGAEWAMRLKPPAGALVLLDGRRVGGEARWTDRDSGRNLYVGKAVPVESADLLAVIDTALPARIRGQLETQLPLFMHHFSERLGALPAKPMLFASYDLSHRTGQGRQGGTLPGQVFTHFYGAGWPERMASPSLGDELAWFFAHEAAHLYQRQIYGPDSADAWIHEGGADAFALLALKDTVPGAAPKLHGLVEANRTKCRKLLAGGSVRQAIEAGRFDAAYACGLLINLEIDREVRAARPESGGLYAVWGRYQDKVGRGEAPGEALFLASVADLAGPELPRRLAAVLREADWDRLTLLQDARAP